MPGAIRPPWVEKEEFYHMPFNYCDRWCEKCKLTDICRVFKDEEESKKRYLAQGKDPNSWECVFETVKNSFEKTRKLLEKDAKRFGIDLNNLDEVPEDEEPPLEKFSTYELMKKYSKSLQKLLTELQVVTEDIDEELLVEKAEIISFYSNLIPAKTYRATLSKLEEDNDPYLKENCPDARNSGFILVNSLNEIIFALTKLINHAPLRPMRDKFFKLKKVAINLREMVDDEFEVEERQQNKDLNERVYN